MSESVASRRGLTVAMGGRSRWTHLPMFTHAQAHHGLLEVPMAEPVLGFSLEPSSYRVPVGPGHYPAQSYTCWGWGRSLG